MDHFAKLLDHKIFVPQEYLWKSSQRVAIYVVLISCLHLLLRYLISRWCACATTTSADQNGCKQSPMTQTLVQNSFQATNLLVNFFLGSLGLYYWFIVLPSDCTDEEKMMGGVSDIPGDVKLSHCHAPAFFTEAQLGYQLWSIPVSIIIHEPAIMLFHHIAVVVATFLYCSLAAGFHYFSVYFFGVIEISSVFLSIMNAFKSRPAWSSQWPTFFSIIKLLFAFSFFYTRVYIWIPNLYDHMRIAFAEGARRSKHGIIVPIILAAGCIPAAFLTFLQLWWAAKIVKGLLRMAGVGNYDEYDRARKQAQQFAQHYI